VKCSTSHDEDTSHAVQQFEAKRRAQTTDNEADNNQSYNYIHSKPQKV